MTSAFNPLRTLLINGTLRPCNVSIGGLTMRWDVVNAGEEDGGGVVLGGMTTGSQPLWNDEFWFELGLDDTPPMVRYWGDQVVWRQDRAS
jgi:hypothetical protein